mgnify:CR=1 FL=1
MLIIDHLAKSFGNNQVLNKISLECPAGKCIGIMGENGAGKTTLFRCVAGLEQYSGTINAPYEPLKDHLGYLQAESFFLSRMTGREYLQLLCNGRSHPLPNLAEKNLFDLPLDRYAAAYSTGMKKKLALTGILLLENEVYILDEPYNGVDIHSNMLITEIVLELKKLNKVILIASHIFSTLKETCDEIYVLQQGSFQRKALKEDFHLLEEEMKKTTIGNKIAQLDLK